MPLRIVLVLLLTAVPVPGFAHMILNGPHGGEVEDATPGPNLHIETVVKGSTVTVYLSDFNETAISATGVAGKIIVLANEKKDYFNLAPSGPNALTGQGNFHGHSGDEGAGHADRLRTGAEGSFLVSTPAVTFL